MCVPTTTAPAPFLATPYEFAVIAAAERAAAPYSALDELAGRARRAVAGDPASQSAFDATIRLIERMLPQAVAWDGGVRIGCGLRAARA